jgi:glycosyltransferase involved in cell wall biosynthesis
MNQIMAARLEAHGAVNVTIIRPGTDAPPRPIVFGVIGRTYNDGRKGEALVARAVADGFLFVACGVGVGRARRARALTRGQWPCSTPYTIATRDAFYSAIDYLVVTSTVEGGPVPLLEAIARGVPVIAPPTVGWCGEFPTIPYDVGSYDSLRSVLYRLTNPPTWEEWADAHAARFKGLNGQRR